jgi:hypothetical protein
MGSEGPIQQQKLQTAAYMSSGEHWSSEWQTDRDSTYNYGGQNDSSLEHFLSRPVKIHETTWTVGGSLGFEINPWTLFFDNPAVLKRIANFELLRCDLRVKILVNGTPFHYGLALASYLPLAVHDQFHVDTVGTTLDMVAKSQRLKIFLNPTKSQGGDLLLPYFYPTNWMSISQRIFDDMGTINIKSFVPLKHANGGTTSVNITVLAWAENVEMCIPTTFVAQSGEYGQGIISKPASALASVADAVPEDSPIAPFAKATSMVSTSVGKVARLFGFSRPPILDTVKLYRPRLFGSLANVDSDEAVHKLTLDSKQELSIDPRTVGLSDHDELDIKSIATRESYLTTVPWVVSAVSGTQLFATRITPMMYRKNGIALYQTPSCWVTAPFKFWRGSYKIRFHIIASAYHKGRLLVSYDPNAILAGVDEFNTAYTRILDLSEDNSFTIIVPWTQPAAFRRVIAPQDHPRQWEEGNLIVVDRANNNGVLRLTVLNDLVTPESVTNNDININVYTSMCDDFEVAAPSGHALSNLTYFEPQSGIFRPQSGEVEAKDQEVAPIGDGKHDQDDNTFLVFFGERILSIRSLLKRYCLHSGHASKAVALKDLRTITINRNSFPNYKGHDPTGIDDIVGPAKYNFSNNTYLNYFTPAFVGRRGSIRYKHTYDSVLSHVMGRLSVSRAPDVSTYSTVEFALSTELGSISENHRDLTFPSKGYAGVALSSNHVVGCLETDIPYYAPVRFSFARTKEVNTGLAVDYTNEAFISEEFPRAHDSVTALSRYVAAGEDFSLYLFIGVPVMYSETIPTPL